MLAAGDVELLSPAEPVFSEAEQHGSDRAPVAERLGSSANPPAAPDAASGNAPADPAVATRGSPRTSAHEAPSPDDSAWGAGAATLPAGARQPAAAESAAPDEAGTAPAAAAADGSPDTKASRSPPWRRRRRPFHTASLLVQPSASGEAGLEHAHGSGLLTPSGMAADLRSGLFDEQHALSADATGQCRPDAHHFTVDSASRDHSGIPPASPATIRNAGMDHKP